MQKKTVGAKAEEAGLQSSETATNALLAHSFLWRNSLGSGSRKRRLSGDPAETLAKEFGWKDSIAERVVQDLVTSEFLGFTLGKGWEVVTTGLEDPEDPHISREFLALRDRYVHRDVSDEPLENFIGVSKHVEEIRRRIGLAAKDDELVLITGETGVGKGLVARLVHDLGDRSNKPFVHLNCASLPEGVLESELFGHEKGAFTSAHSSHQGCFERAEGGTLFLDEIGEISLSFQMKLLQVLEEGIFFRVGGERELKVRARIIVATNRNLVHAVKDKTFRRDLFYRIYGIPIPILSLRERREDLPHLVAHTAAMLGQKKGTSYRVSNDGFKKLTGGVYPWPGNVRELLAVMRLARHLASGDVVEENHIEFPGMEMLTE